MTRKTVKIQMPEDSEPRDFHLFEGRVDAFVATVRAEGGVAAVGPLHLGPELRSMLASCGVNPDSIR